MKNLLPACALLLVMATAAFALPPVFNTRIDYEAGYEPIFATSADLDGDGDSDFLVVNRRSLVWDTLFDTTVVSDLGTVARVTASGDGWLVPLAGSFAGTLPVAACVADFDSDGDMDIAVANSAPHSAGRTTIFVIRNYPNSSGTAFCDVSGAPTAVCTADFDGDGDFDLACVSPDGGVVDVLSNDGAGGFSLTASYAVAPGTDWITAADLNADGYDDLAVSGVGVMLNNTDGTFAPAASYPAGGAMVVAADIDGDGDADLITSEVTVLHNNGDGTFGAGQYLRDGAASVVAADLNGDGDVDLASITPGASQLWVRLNNGDGSYGPDIVYTTGASPTSICAGDADGDGDLDLGVTYIDGWGPDGFSLYLNRGDGTFRAEGPTHYSLTSSSTAVVASDFNRDGIEDLAATVYGVGLAVLMGNGDGTFQDGVEYPAGTDPVFISAADLNGDGYDDLIETSDGAAEVYLLMNKGDGTFTGHTPLDVWGPPKSVVAADLNGDGKLDLATANNSSDHVCVLLNQGNGIFSINCQYSSLSQVERITAADFDGDGDIDLATSNWVNGIAIFLNDGYGRFYRGQRIDLNWGAVVAIVSADFDKDGDVDIAASWNSVVVLLNTGDGTFSDPAWYSGGLTARSMHTADFDGDGNMDLVTLEESGDRAAVLRNRGDGTFESAGKYSVGDRPLGVFAADLDGDGDPDLATATVGSDAVTVILNELWNWGAGDVNCDGVVDVADVVLLGNYLDGLTALSGACSDNPGDVNADGVVDDADYEVLYSALTGTL